MAKRLTNEIVDGRLLPLNIKRLDDYIKSDIPIHFECLIDSCHFIWKTSPNAIMSLKSGCPKCAGNLQKTNESIDEKLLGRNIKRLGDYINNRTPISFMCLIEHCLYGSSGEWIVAPGGILNGGHGCPKCYGNIKKSNEDIDKMLIGKNIKRLDDSNGNNVKIHFECLVDGCHHGANMEWETYPYTIEKGHGCPKCADILFITNEEADKRLFGRNIKRLEDYKGSHVPIHFLCEVSGCRYGSDLEWTTTLARILSGNNCPKCMGTLPLTNENIDIRLKENNIPIKRLGDCIGGKHPIEFQCLKEECNNIWKRTPHAILSGNGCPKCKFGKNEKLVLTTLQENSIAIQHQKFLRDFAPTERRINVDFYLSQYNTIIEYNGRQHYEPVQFGGCTVEQANDNLIHQKERDVFVEQFCKEHNIYLIWIDGRKYTNNKLRKYMMEEIIPSLQMIIKEPNNPAFL